jgi:hypothetical protein
LANAAPARYWSIRRPDTFLLHADRPIFVVRLQPQPGVDAIKGLRWILKISLRQFGLKCVDIRREEGGAPWWLAGETRSTRRPRKGFL